MVSSKSKQPDPELLSARKGVKISWEKYTDEPLEDEREIICGLTTTSGLSPKELYRYKWLILYYVYLSSKESKNKPKTKKQKTKNMSSCKDGLGGEGREICHFLYQT